LNPHKICITLPEWEAICEHFAHATHYLEKALYKMLSQSIVPAIVAELKVCLRFFSCDSYCDTSPQEVERKRKVEEAVVHRKRSSRIALKETEKEEARAAALRQAEEDEKLARSKRMEARAKKEDAERQKREQAREQRRLERETRELKISNRNQPKETSRCDRYLCYPALLS
jgi:flagellar biosynthesis GTPase FlhF